MDEIKENDYNLNVSLYVFPEEEEDKIDIEKEWKEVHQIEGELSDIESKILGYLKEVD